MNTYEDSRIIVLNSSDAIKLNGTYNSSIIFPMNGLLRDDPKYHSITYSIDCKSDTTQFLYHKFK